MSSIFSTQNLQTFLRRKNLRPPPPSRGGPPGPRPPPPNRGRSPPGPPPLERGLSLVECSAAFVSSAIILLLKFAGHRVVQRGLVITMRDSKSSRHSETWHK